MQTKLLPKVTIKQKWRSVASKIMGSLGEQEDFGVDIDNPSVDEYMDSLETNSFNSLLHYDEWDPRGFFVNQNSSGFVFEFPALVGGEDGLDSKLASVFQDTLPVGSNLQCMLIADHRIDGLLDEWESQVTTDQKVLKKLASHRRKYLADSALSTKYPLRLFRVVISYSVAGKLDPLGVDDLLILKGNLIAQLEAVFGEGDFCLDPGELLSFLKGILYPSKDLMEHNTEYDPLNSLARQLAEPGGKMSVFDDHLSFERGGEEWKIKSFSLSGMPRKWKQSLMANFIGDSMSDLRQIPCPFIIHYGVHVLPASTSKRKAKKIARIESQAVSKISSKIPSILRQADEWGFAKHRVDLGDRYLETSMSVVLLCPGDSLPLAEQRLISMWKGNGFLLRADDYIQLPSFLSVLPMSWGDGWHKRMKGFSRMTTALSCQPANLLPFQGEWIGNRGHGAPLVGRRGQLMNFNPFDSGGNYNIIVAGTPGSGKSVFMQEVMRSTLSKSGRVFVLDVGRSFEMTCKQLGGTFLDFSTKSNLCINPFSTIALDDGSDPDYADYLNDTFSFLKGVVATMAAPNDGLADTHLPRVERAIKKTWDQYQNQGSITKVAEILLQSDEPMDRQIGGMLYPYTADGPYGRFFEGPANVDLKGSLIVIEFEELKNRKDLQTVVVQMMIVQISNEMFGGGREIPFQIVMDEAWDLLKGKGTSEFIESIARKARKYMGGLMVGTQGVNDYFASAGARAAFDNSEWKCLMQQQPESIRSLKNSPEFGLTTQLEYLLNSVATKKGFYSEICIKGKGGAAVVRLKLDPFSLLLYSTAPEDYRAVMEKINSGSTLEDAIGDVLKDRGQYVELDEKEDV